MKIKYWSAILAVWIWWNTIQSHQTWSATTSSNPLTADPPDYPKVNFDASNADGETYGQMIKLVREILVENGSYSHGIPRLRHASTVPDSERYVLVSITEARGHTVTFAIDATTTYIAGYRVGNQRYFFTEAPANAPDLLFTDITAPLPPRRSSNYNHLQARAGVDRINIPLGLQSLLGAISTLTSRPEDPRSLIIVIQMISEAVRYWEIESRVRNDAEFLPDAYMVDLETNWGSLSEQIQISDFLAFRTPITIGNRVADNLNSFVIAGMYLMLFVCNPAPKASSALTSTNHLQLIIKQQQPANLLLGAAADDTCEHSDVEPRTRITGRNGLCVDVQGFVYKDNNPIILFHCRTDTDFKNQLWTLRDDGRIQSLEKCFAATGTTPGSGVVIHECETLDDSAIRWAMLYSGELVNAHSGLSLTAKDDGTDIMKLTLEKNDFSSFQTWKATNNLTPVDVYIGGENNQCIYYNGRRGVYVENCNKESSTQKWRLYPDSTIRPMDWLDGCMEIESVSGGYVQAGYCSGYPELHKWVFAHDGSIMNWKSRLVVEASKTYPGYLYGMPYQGGANQLWTLQFI